MVASEIRSLYRDENDGRQLSEAGFTGFIGFPGLWNYLNRGLSRMTRISRIWGDLENRQVTGKSVSEVVYNHDSEVGIIR